MGDLTRVILRFLQHLWTNKNYHIKLKLKIITMKTLNHFLNVKNYFRIILFLCLTLVVINCRKDDDDEITPIIYPEENPLSAYMINTGFSESSNFINSGDYEFGLVFSPNVNGKIKAITAKIPDISSTMRVTIWDYDTKTVLRTEIVNVSAANTSITKSITELPIVKDKKYLISMNSNDWYNRTKAGGGSAIYPITAGNIKFTEYLWKSGTGQTFPTNVDDSYYGGDLSFVFQQTN